jgi:hypothetical protein
MMSPLAGTAAMASTILFGKGDPELAAVPLLAGAIVIGAWWHATSIALGSLAFGAERWIGWAVCAVALLVFIPFVPLLRDWPEASLGLVVFTALSVSIGAAGVRYRCAPILGQYALLLLYAALLSYIWIWLERCDDCGGEFFGALFVLAALTLYWIIGSLAITGGYEVARSLIRDRDHEHPMIPHV